MQTKLMTTWQSLNEGKTKISYSQNNENEELLSDEIISEVNLFRLGMNSFVLVSVRMIDDPFCKNIMFILIYFSLP